MAKKLYQVAAGETLKSIATDKLGDESRWAELAYINSLDAPYFITPGQLLLLPSNDAPLTVLITKGITEPKRSAVVNSQFSLSPAEWGLLAVGAFLLFAASR